MSPVPWTLAVGPTSVGPVQELAEWESWSWSRSLDEGCQVTVSTSARDGLLVDELATDLWVYRGATLEQRFRVVAVDQEWGPDGEDVVELTAVCYRRMLGSRHVRSPLTFSGVSQGLIIWGLIDHAQTATNGDLGITLVDPGPVLLRDRSYDPPSNILDMIRNLTQVINGPAWDIDPSLGLHVRPMTSFPTNPTPMELGSSLVRLRRPTGSTAFANVGIASGNRQVTTPEFVEDAGLSTDVRGRWEKASSFSSVIQQSTLVEHAGGIVAAGLSPSIAWEADVRPESFLAEANYGIGEFVTVVQPRSTVAPLEPVQPTVTAQVLSVDVDVSADGGVDVKVMAVTV